MGVDAEYAAHAAQARARVRAIGLADCIHYAPDWQPRVDALYDRLAATGDWPIEGPGLLADGRMVVIGNVISVFE